jgi:competence ComEA-like helix-hairpin-helix protein
MKAGREKVFGSFALFAVTAILIFITLPARIPREPVAPDIPFTIEKPGTIAVEIAGESGRNGVYFIPKETPLTGFLDMAGITSADKRLALGIPIDLNRSSLEDLVLVPGIGEKTAEKIVEERGLNGTFGKLEELMRVKGIKEKRLEKLRRYLCIGC